VPRAVGQQQSAVRVALPDRPAVAAHGFPGTGHRDRTDLEIPAGRQAAQRGQPGRDHGAEAGPGEHADRVGEPMHSAQAGARAAGRRIAVRETAREIFHAGTAVDRQKLDVHVGPAVMGLDRDLAGAGIFQDVGRELGRDQRHAPRGLGAEPRLLGKRDRPASRLPRIRRLGQPNDHIISNALS